MSHGLGDLTHVKKYSVKQGVLFVQTTIFVMQSFLTFADGYKTETEKDPNIKTKSSYQDLNYATSTTGSLLPNIDNIDSIIEDEMKNGDKIACKMVIEVGMHQLLLASKTLQFDSIEQLEIKDNLAKVNPKLTDIVGNDPDELKLLSNDEIGGLSSGDILLTTLGNDRQTIHSADVLDLASDTSFNSEQHESSDNDINPDNFYTKEAMPSSSTENTPCSMSVTCTMEQSEENENIEETESLNTNPHDQECKQNTHIFIKVDGIILISSLPGSKGNCICQSKQDLTIFTVTMLYLINL